MGNKARRVWVSARPKPLFAEVTRLCNAHGVPLYGRIARGMCGLAQLSVARKGDMDTHRSSRLQLAWKIFVALLAGAVVPAMVVGMLFWRGYAVTQVAGASSLISAMFQVPLLAVATAMLIALAFTAAHAFILGLPLLLLGMRLHAVRWWSILPLSFLIGLIPAALAGSPSLVEVLPMGGFGLIGGLTFWLVWHFWIGRTSRRGGADTGPVFDAEAAGVWDV